MLGNLCSPAIYHYTHVLYSLLSGAKMGTFGAAVLRGSVSHLSPNILLSTVSSHNNNNNLEQSYINWKPSFTPMLHMTVPTSRYSWLIGSYVSQKEAGFVSTSLSLFGFCCWTGTVLLGSLKHKDCLTATKTDTYIVHPNYYNIKHHHY